MNPDSFLFLHEPQREWIIPARMSAEFTSVAAFDGRGDYPLEVALVRAPGRPPVGRARELWKARHAHAPSPLLLVAAYESEGRWCASICGPTGDDPPVVDGLDLDQIERFAKAALAEPTRHAAIRFLVAMLPEVGADLPGVRNQGMFATHELREGVQLRADWAALTASAAPMLALHGRDLVTSLGFSITTHGTATSVLAIDENKRAIAVFLDEGEGFEEPIVRFDGSSPVMHALAVADRESLPWVVLTRGRQIRVYSARPDVGVGRKGRAETFVETNLALLPDAQAGYLTLLFSADALREGGTFEEVLDESRDYSADLGIRLRDRIYRDAVPSLATALARRQPGVDLNAVYEQALVVLFRLLFVAYAEDKDLLPYRSNGAYREHALKTIARSLTQRMAAGPLQFDQHATDLWDDVRSLWLAVDKGNSELGVPAYNGGMFSADPEISAAGGALAAITLTNADFGPALAAMLVDQAADGVTGPVDFRSLSVREFGTIYEGLLESGYPLPQPISRSTRAITTCMGTGDVVAVRAGEVYFHNRSGVRKSSGSYFTRPFAVEHLLNHSLEPALDDRASDLCSQSFWTPERTQRRLRPSLISDASISRWALGISLLRPSIGSRRDSQH